MTICQVTQEHTEKCNDQSDQGTGIFKHHGEHSRVFAAANSLQRRISSLNAPKYSPAEVPRDAFKDKSARQHHIIPEWVPNRCWMAQVSDSFIDGHAAADREDSHRYNK